MLDYSDPVARIIPRESSIVNISNAPDTQALVSGALDIFGMHAIVSSITEG